MANQVITVQGEEIEDVDLSLLTLEQVHDYRLQLSAVLHERFEVFAEDRPTDELHKWYWDKIQSCKQYIGTD